MNSTADTGDLGPAFQALFDGAPDPALLFALDGTLLQGNRAARGAFGAAPTLDKLDRSAHEALARGVHRAARSSIPTTIRVNLVGRTLMMRAWRTRFTPASDATACIVMNTISKEAITPKVLKIRGQIQEIAKDRDRAHHRASQLRAEATHLRRLASIDSLTGLLHGRVFEDLLHELLARGKGGCLFLLDLDRFKTVNDTFGHAAGDAVLKHVASSLTSGMRSSDLVARLGGDEFAFWANELNADRAGQVAKRLANVIERPILWTAGATGAALEVGTSIGIATAPRDATALDALLHHADAAMYARKHQRKRGGDGDDVRLTVPPPLAASSGAA